MCQDTTTRLIGGADRDRTDDLRLAKPALSQLSYSPVGVFSCCSTGSLSPPPTLPDHPLGAPRDLPVAQTLVGLGGFEPPTSRLSGGRSNQLSYRPAPRGHGFMLWLLASVSKN